MERSEYEQRVLEELSTLLLGPGGRARRLSEEDTGSRVAVEEVRLQASSSGTGTVIVLYRDLHRRECLFGWRMEAVEPASPGDDPSTIELEIGPEIWTTIVWANFREHICSSPHSLPEECSPEGITWTG